MSYSQDMINSMCVWASVLQLPPSLLVGVGFWNTTVSSTKVKPQTLQMAWSSYAMQKMQRKRCAKMRWFFQGFQDWDFRNLQISSHVTHCCLHCFRFDVVNRFALMFKPLLDGRPDIHSWPCSMQASWLCITYTAGNRGFFVCWEFLEQTIAQNG